MALFVNTKGWKQFKMPVNMGLDNILCCNVLHYAVVKRNEADLSLCTAMETHPIYIVMEKMQGAE